MGWVLWRDPKHGDVLRRQYRTKYGSNADEETEEDGGAVDPFEKENGEEGDDEDDEDDEGENDASQGELLQRKLRLAVAYLNELTDEEKSRLTEFREKDFEERTAAYERTLKGETDCTADELDEYVFLPCYEEDYYSPVCLKASPPCGSGLRSNPRASLRADEMQRVANPRGNHGQRR
jgi:hypothetical protein